MKSMVIFIIANFAASLCFADTTASPTPGGNLSCDQICGELTNSDGSVKGLSGSGSWSSSDTQWCSMYGGGEVGSTTTAQPGQSEMPVTQTRLNQCTYHGNSQLLDHCLAYDQDGKTNTPEKLLSLLDVAAAGMCGMACMAQATPSSLASLKMCRTAGDAVAVSDIIQSFIIKTNGAGGAVATLLAAGGALVAGGAAAASAGNQILPQPYQVTLPGLDPVSVNGTTIPGTGVQPQTVSFAGPAEHANQDAAMKKAKMMACEAAGMFAIEAGMRIAAESQANSAKNGECSTIEGLLSSKSSVGTGVNGAVVGNGVGGSTGSAGSGGTNSTGTASAGSQLQCIAQNGISGCNGVAAAATAADGSALGNSGLDQALAPAAQQLLNSGALNGGAGSAVGGAMSAGGDVKTALMQIASTAQQMQGETPGAMVSSGGGGAKKSGDSASSNNPFANLLGKDSGAGGLSGSRSIAEFGESKTSDDIWHTGSTFSLFQIVSNKITHLHSRVDAVEWSTQQNRVLSRMPSKN